MTPEERQRLTEAMRDLEHRSAAAMCKHAIFDTAPARFLAEEIVAHRLLTIPELSPEKCVAEVAQLFVNFKRAILEDFA
jgi:hypothetical protein